MSTLRHSEKIATTGAAAVASSAGNGQAALEQIPAQVSQQLEAAVETARGTTSEMLQYTGQMLHAYAAHLQSLAGCKTPQSFMERQMAFMNSSMQEYSQAVSKLIDAAQVTSPK